MNDLFNNASQVISVDRPAQVKLKAWVGIDPGGDGGIACIDFNGHVKKWGMPNNGNGIEVLDLVSILDGLKEEYNVTLILEDVHSIFGTSAKSNFSFGFTCGAINAIVVTRLLKLLPVQPKAWQKIIWANSDKVYKPLKEKQKTASIDTKATSLNACKRLFPGLDLRKSARASKPHDGITDAILIAEYGRRCNL